MSNTPFTKSKRDDPALDNTLRPLSFDDFVGQDKIKQNLSILIEAAQHRNEPLEHILLHGPSGLGKTTLAHIIANAVGSDIKITSGAILEKGGDIASILTNLPENSIFFIDEVHRLNKLIEEILYPAMENFKLDIVIGKGTSAKTIQLDLPRFTIIAATTRIALLSAPFRSRFGAHYKLQFYTSRDIKQIVKRSALLLNININDDALGIIADSSRFTPRIANKLLKRTRDLAQVKKAAAVTAPIAEECLHMLDIDKKGLELTDRKILETVIQQYNGGPVGIKTIAAAIAEEEETIEDVYEPYLMRVGFLARTPRGRIATKEAYEYLNLKAGKLL